MGGASAIGVRVFSHDGAISQQYFWPLRPGGLKSEVQHRRIEAQMSKRTYQQLSENERQAIALDARLAAKARPR